MTSPFQLQFATYTFPNQTFQIDDHRLDIDTPIEDIRRYDGGVIQAGYLRPKKWRINGKIYGTDVGSVHNELNTLKRSLHNKGLGASFFYRSDRYAYAQLAPGGISAVPEKGLYEYLYNVDILLVSDPFVESITRSSESGSRSNSSEIDQVTVGGNFPTYPVFNFMAGTHNFNSAIRVDNLANSFFFQFSGGLMAGQTLIVDCVAGCVLLQVGLTMIDALSYFGGNLDFILEPDGTNDVLINAATLSYTINFKNRWYI